MYVHFPVICCSLGTLDLGAKSSKARNKYDTDTAWFWVLAGNTSAVTGAFFNIAREVSGHLVSQSDWPSVGCNSGPVTNNSKKGTVNGNNDRN